MENRTTDVVTPPVADRVDALVSAMTIEEEPARLLGARVGTGPSGSGVAPHLSTPLGRRGGVSTVDATSPFPFGHGPGRATFARSPVRVTDRQWATDGEVEVGRDVRDPGPRPGADVVQLYLPDRVVQPVVRLVDHARRWLTAASVTHEGVERA